MAGAGRPVETVNKVRKAAVVGRGGAQVRADLLGPHRPLYGHCHSEMGRRRGLEQKCGVTWCVLKVSFRKDVGWTEIGLWICSEARENRIFFSGLYVVCERKMKGNYKLFWSGKMELPFID